MRLKQLFISDYKNLKNFTLDFSKESFLETFVGKNGSGKSNCIEALLEVLRHIFQYDWDANRYDIYFSYKLKYELEGTEHLIEYDLTREQLVINGKERVTVGKTPLPDNVLIYYAGHNSVVSDHLNVFAQRFAERLIRADQEDSRPFIGINNTYNDLLLAVFALLPEESEVKEYVFQRLAINEVGDILRLELKRPHYAKKKDFDVRSNDPNEPNKYWRLAGTARELLDKLDENCKEDQDDRVRTEGYLDDSDSYQQYYSIAKIKAHFQDYSANDYFRMLDNLKSLGMLGTITLDIRLVNNKKVTSNVFSDGQFQAIYLYSISEIFKNTNSITIMDEPDSFLHPEWQALCSEQIQTISNQAASTNHILLTTHSAVTLINSPQKKVRYFEEHDGEVRTYDLPKREAVRRLCKGVITYTEKEQMLSILNAIQIEKKPVLFTEGSTDPLIIKSAWYKLYPQLEMPFIPFYAFSCSYINQLITDQRIHREMGGRKVFALFDFDEAYNQWNSLNGPVIQQNVSQGLVKKWNDGEAYALMLPIPQNKQIQNQVFKDDSLTSHFEGKSYCMIEHEFYGLAETADYFVNETVTGGGNVIKFNGNKTNFASDVVPSLSSEAFEPFRYMLNWIKDQCEHSNG